MDLWKKFGVPKDIRVNNSSINNELSFVVISLTGYVHAMQRAGTSLLFGLSWICSFLVVCFGIWRMTELSGVICDAIECERKFLASELTSLLGLNEVLLGGWDSFTWGGGIIQWRIILTFGLYLNTCLKTSECYFCLFSSDEDVKCTECFAAREVWTGEPIVIRFIWLVHGCRPWRWIFTQVVVLKTYWRKVVFCTVWIVVFLTHGLDVG